MRTPRFLTMLLACAAVLLSGCSEKYNDDELWKELDKQAARIKALEDWQTTVNTNIGSLQGLVSALEGKDYVTNVTKFTDPAPGGVRITFQKSGEVTVWNGAKGDTGDKGADGSPGASPTIAVAEFPAGSGVYYWTLNGAFIEAGGAKVPVTGADGDAGAPGATPKVVIGTDEYWYISADGTATGEAPGTGWTSTGVKATGDDGAPGDAIFAADGVDDTDEDYVIFTLADGTTTITLPRYKGLGIVFGPRVVDGTYTMIGTEGEVTFTTTGTPTAIGVATEVPAGWTIAIDKAAGTITVTCTEIGMTARFLIVATDGTGASANYWLTVTSTSHPLLALTAGELQSIVEALGLTGASSLTLGGTIDYRDFVYLKTLVAAGTLAEIDLAATTVAAYGSSPANGIPEYVFSLGGGNTTLTTFVFPNGIMSIGDSAFYACSGLTGLTIGSGVKTIGINAFARCSGLTGSLTIPDGVETIGNYAFISCSGLTSLTLGSGVTTIGVQAFHDCTGLTGSLTIPVGVTSIGASAFSGCSGFDDIRVSWSEPIVYTTYMLPNGKPVYVPSASVSAYKAASGWKGHTILSDGATEADLLTLTAGGLQTVVEAAGLTGASSLTLGGVIDARDFAYLRSLVGAGTGTLTAIDLSATTVAAHGTSPANAIPAEAFYFEYGNPTLTTFVYPAGITSIGANAFRDCSGLTGSLTIPDGVTSIGADAFAGCNGFDGALTIPNSVTSIGAEAFNGCSRLTGALTIPDGVTTIGDYTFRQCSGFGGSLTIGSDVETIGAYAFSGCTGLTGTLTIPNSVKTIGASAFSGCEGLTGALTIPDGVTSLGRQAFQYCSGFDGTLTIGSGLTTIEPRTFMNCSKLTGPLTIPDGITSIGESAFYECTGFTGTLTLGSGLTTIGNSAFDTCTGLTGTLTIPVGVTAIGMHAFSGCNGFDDVRLSWPVPISYTTSMLPWGTAIYVPSAYVDAYASWGSSGNHSIYGE